MNSVGYYACLVMLSGHTAASGEQNIQSSLNEPGGSLILRIPLRIPYLQDSENYNPTSGHITYDGKVFQAIKQKIYRDSLYLVCVYDERTTDAENKVSDLASSFAGEQQKDAHKLLISFAKYFFRAADLEIHAQSGWMIERDYIEPIASNYQRSSLAIFHPPRIIC